jgi:hypothetical protein
VAARAGLFIIVPVGNILDPEGGTLEKPMETAGFVLSHGEAKTYKSNHPSDIRIVFQEGTILEFTLAPNLPLRIVSLGDIKEFSIDLKKIDPIRTVE